MTNERTKHLAEQARQYAEYMTPQGLEWFDTFKEKYAELIVKECNNFIKNEYCRDFGIGWRDDLTNEMSKYFGVPLEPSAIINRAN